MATCDYPCETRVKRDSDGDGVLWIKMTKCPNVIRLASNDGCPNTKPTVNLSDSEISFVRENMLPVSGGNFTFGCNIGNDNCDRDEFPKKNVSIPDFYIQKNEVTNSQFLAFLNAYQSEVVKEGEFAGQKIIYPSTSGLTKKNGIWSVKKGYENHPVVDVTWFGAVTFANYYGLEVAYRSRMGICR